MHTETVTKEDEAKLWNSGVMGVTTPKTLQNAAFYGVGKMFALRGGIEHRSLKLTQLKRMSNPDRNVYYENVSKNRNGSFKKIHIKSKVVPVYACPEAGERCLVYILDKYISKLPSFAVDKDVFYVRPLHKLPIDSSAPWYAATPVGRETLHKKFRLMCQQAGIDGNKTNHSLRATGATQLYESGVPEKLIQERTGHRSLEALRMYERTNENQHKAVSSILSATGKTSYAEHMYADDASSISSTVATVHQASTLTQTQNTQPGFSFHNIYGCTININAASTNTKCQSAIGSAETESETDIDKLFAAIKEPDYYQ